MSILLRALALVGAVAHGVNRLLARVLPFLPQRVPGALLLAGLLAAGTFLSANATTEAIASRPEPTPLRLGEVLEGGVNEWITVRGILSGPHVDNSLYANTDVHFLRIRDDPHDREDRQLVPSGPRVTIERLGGTDGVPRWFYVLRDPDDPGQGIVVRSPRDAEAIRHRVIRARATGTHEGVPLLAEVGLAAAGTELPDTRDALASPSGDTIVGGIFRDATEMAGGGWRYALVDPADGTTLAFVDAPHPPEALPVELSGLVATDAYHLGLVLETDEMATALDGVAHSDTRLFLDGVGPLLPEVSYLPAVLLGAAAALLVVSQLVGYPIFRRGGEGSRAARRPVVGEPIAAELDGRLPAPDGTRLVRGEAVELSWLPAAELERRAWQLRHQLPQAVAADAPRLTLLATEAAYLLPMEPIRPSLTVEPGDVVTSTAVRPGLRIRAPGLRATMTFATEDDRARAARELNPATPPAAAGDLSPQAARPVEAITPVPRLATAGGLALVALAIVAAAAIDVVTGRAAPAGLLLPAIVAGALLLFGRGVLIGSAWAHEMLPSIALLGMVVAVTLAFAGSLCGSWLAPTATDCPAFSPLSLVVPGMALATFAFGLWATPRLVREPRR